MRKVVCLICFVFVAMLLIPANTLAVTLVDNFDSYATGPVNTVAKPPWTEAWNQGAAASTIAGSGNQYLVAAVSPTFLAAQTDADWRGVTAIPNADTATTLFLRFRAETSTANSSFGLTDMATPTGYQTGGFGDYANQMRVSVQSGVLGFDVRNGGGFNLTNRYAINVGQWYNVWAVVNNSTDKYDVYMTTGLDDAITGTILYQQTLQGFRKTSTNPLVDFLAMTQGGTGGNNGLPLDIDDIYLTPGSHLEIPEPATMILLGLGGLVLRRRK